MCVGLRRPVGPVDELSSLQMQAFPKVGQLRRPHEFPHTPSASSSAIGYVARCTSGWDMIVELRIIAYFEAYRDHRT